MLTLALIHHANLTSVLQPNWRTELCAAIQEGRSCPHGERCDFAHSHEELRSQVCSMRRLIILKAHALYQTVAVHWRTIPAGWCVCTSNQHLSAHLQAGSSLGDASLRMTAG